MLQSVSPDRPIFTISKESRFRDSIRECSKVKTLQSSLQDISRNKGLSISISCKLICFSRRGWSANDHGRRNDQKTVCRVQTQLSILLRWAFIDLGKTPIPPGWSEFFSSHILENPKHSAEGFLGSRSDSPFDRRFPMGVKMYDWTTVYNKERLFRWDSTIKFCASEVTPEHINHKPESFIPSTEVHEFRVKTDDPSSWATAHHLFERTTTACVTFAAQLQLHDALAREISHAWNESSEFVTFGMIESICWIVKDGSLLRIGFVSFIT
jgi:hypothetical protein